MSDQAERHEHEFVYASVGDKFTSVSCRCGWYYIVHNDSYKLASDYAHEHIAEISAGAVGANITPHRLADEGNVGATTDSSSAPAELVRRLEHFVALNEPRHGGPYMGSAAQACVEAMAKAAIEIERLLRWKAEAMAVQRGWEESFERAALDPLTSMGKLKHEAMADEILRLREHSVLLNKVAWELEQAYATIPQGGVMLTTDIEHNLPRWVAAIQRDSTRRWPRVRR